MNRERAAPHIKTYCQYRAAPGSFDTAQSHKGRIFVDLTSDEELSTQSKRARGSSPVVSSMDSLRQARMDYFSGRKSCNQKSLPVLTDSINDEIFSYGSTSARDDVVIDSTNQGEVSLNQSTQSNQGGCVELDWFLLTSANLSQAAWGVLQKNNSSLYIKSFELGVLFIPSRVVSNYRQFSCTPLHPLLGMSRFSSNANSSRKRFVVSPITSQSSNSEIYFPVPCSLGSDRYSSVDNPWSW